MSGTDPVSPEEVLRAVEAWARTIDAGLGRCQVDIAAEHLRQVAGCPSGCYVGDPLPDGPDPEGAPEDREAMHYVGLEVAYEVQSINVLLRMHHRQRTRERNALAAQIMAQVGRDTPRPVPRRVHYRAWRRRRILDEENFVGGFKMLQDVLMQVGLIWEDSRYWLMPSYEQHLAGRTMPRVEVEIWDYPEGVWCDEQRRIVERAMAGDTVSGQEARRKMAGGRAKGKSKRGVRGWDPEAVADRCRQVRAYKSKRKRGSK